MGSGSFRRYADPRVGVQRVAAAGQADETVQALKVDV